MADLGSKTTDGRLSFIKYVTDNKRFAEIEFEVEKDKPAFIFTKTGTNMKPSAKAFKGGTKIKILDKKLYEFNKTKYALCSIGTTKGYIEINKIRKPTSGNGTQYEDEVVDLINAAILEHGAAIDIKIKGDTKIYKKILYAIKVDTRIKQAAGVRGDPKCDIILCQDKTKPLANTSIFISHKKEGGPEAFQQYGGISLAAGKAINSHPAVQKFLELVSGELKDTDQLPFPMVANFKDKRLANLSIFGPDFGEPFSIDHTQLIGQGKPKLTAINKGKYFELDFTSHMSLSGDLSHFKGGYLPVLGATFRAGRGFEYKNKKYVGARVGIYPQKLVATRAGAKIFNL